jgi:hypothetical protein
MHLRRVAEFLGDVGRCACLNKFPKSRPRIRKSPRGQLDLEFVQRLLHHFGLRIPHQVSSRTVNESASTVASRRQSRKAPLRFG